jgi:energy-coupling factor transport system ATP-binding protein
MNSVLEIQGLTYTYPGARHPAVTDVSLEVSPGELIVLAGASGSGKSTLLRAASGLVPHFHGGVIGGRVVVADMDTRSCGPGELAAVVGSLFQDPETQVVTGTPRAELAFPLENRGLGASATARGVEEAALALGIAHLLDRSTAELSGGELQRVALGAALAGRPSLVLLDEPTSQLDPVAGDELLGVLRRLNEDFELAIVLAEHRLERCIAWADRVVAMEAGRVVCDATPAEFLKWAPPSLSTPGAKLLSGLGLSPVAGVKRARAALRSHGLVEAASTEIAPEPPPPRFPEPPPPGFPEPPPPGKAVLKFERVWHELRNGPSILRGVSLTVGARERVALMGRNGAGKSTLLRHAAGLTAPTRGRVDANGRVALLLQNPTDYLVHETVAQEVSDAGLATVGLTATKDRHPRDLSGGEKQRLALAIVLDDPGDPATVVCLDEPTRGMDRILKDELALMLRGLDAAVVVATHDPEFVAAFADRVILLADGRPIADGPASEVLSGGTYFATETARILGGAGGALTAEQGIAILTARTGVPA